MDSAFLLGQVFNGLSVGSIYILAALGLALSFGLMRVINMAHGEIVMFGGYIAYLTILVVPAPSASSPRSWPPSSAADCWAPSLKQPWSAVWPTVRWTPCSPPGASA